MRGLRPMCRTAASEASQPQHCHRRRSRAGQPVSRSSRDERLRHRIAYVGARTASARLAWLHSAASGRPISRSHPSWLQGLTGDRFGDQTQPGRGCLLARRWLAPCPRGAAVGRLCDRAEISGRMAKGIVRDQGRRHAHERRCISRGSRVAQSRSGQATRDRRRRRRSAIGISTSRMVWSATGGVVETVSKNAYRRRRPL